MNTAKLSKDEQIAIQTHKIACLRRYYKNMSIGTAMRIKGSMSKTKRLEFTNKINEIKGRIFI